MPGIQPADVRELLDHGATTIVLSQGILNRLGTCPERLKLLKQLGVRVHLLPTQDAVDLYNRYARPSRSQGCSTRPVAVLRCDGQFACLATSMHAE